MDVLHFTTKRNIASEEEIDDGQKQALLMLHFGHALDTMINFEISDADAREIRSCCSCPPAVDRHSPKSHLVPDQGTTELGQVAWNHILYM